MTAKAKGDRPRKVPSDTYRFVTDCGKLFITVGAIDSKPMEAMGRLGKSGGCKASQIEGLGRLVSLALQYEIPPEEVVKQLKGIRCPSSNGYNGTEHVLSCSDGFARALEEFIHKEVDAPQDGSKCPKCGGPLKKSGSNLTCEPCGFERAD
jgi:ribonucleoside-diphosphate reductase alpha chain